MELIGEILFGAGAIGALLWTSAAWLSVER